MLPEGSLVRILLFDVSDDVAVGVIRELQRQGARTHWRIVGDLEMLRTALREEQWDLVVATPGQDRSDVRRGLELCDQASRPIPFVAIGGEAPRGFSGQWFESPETTPLSGLISSNDEARP